MCIRDRVEVMQIVIDPEAVQHSRVAEACYEILGVQSYRTFSIIVMVLLILVFVVKNLFTYFQQKLTLSFVYTNQFRTSERMMRNYLRRGYEFYLNADTAVVQRSITSDVNNMYALILALLQQMCIRDSLPAPEVPTIPTEAPTGIFRSA